MCFSVPAQGCAPFAYFSRGLWVYVNLLLLSAHRREGKKKNKIKNLHLVPISISAFLPLYLSCDSRKVHLVAGHEVKNCPVRVLVLFCVALRSGCRRTHPCSCHLRGRRRWRRPGADGESIVMDQRASRPQP